MRYLRIFAIFLFSFLIWQGHYSGQALNPNSMLTNPEAIRAELFKQEIQKISNKTNQNVQYSWLDFWAKYMDCSHNRTKRVIILSSFHVFQA